jgi:hypothetical protein
MMARRGMRRLCLVEPGGMSYLHTMYITIEIEVKFNRLETIYSLCSRNAYILWRLSAKIRIL